MQARAAGENLLLDAASDGLGCVGNRCGCHCHGLGTQPARQHERAPAASVCATAGSEPGLLRRRLQRARRALRHHGQVLRRPGQRREGCLQRRRGWPRSPGRRRLRHHLRRRSRVREAFPLQQRLVLQTMARVVVSHRQTRTRHPSDRLCQSEACPRAPTTNLSVGSSRRKGQDYYTHTANTLPEPLGPPELTVPRRSPGHRTGPRQHFSLQVVLAAVRGHGDGQPPHACCATTSTSRSSPEATWSRTSLRTSQTAKQLTTLRDGHFHPQQRPAGIADTKRTAAFSHLYGAPTRMAPELPPRGPFRVYTRKPPSSP